MYELRHDELLSATTYGIFSSPRLKGIIAVYGGIALTRIFGADWRCTLDIDLIPKIGKMSREEWVFLFTNVIINEVQESVSKSFGIAIRIQVRKLWNLQLDEYILSYFDQHENRIGRLGVSLNWSTYYDFPQESYKMVLPSYEDRPAIVALSVSPEHILADKLVAIARYNSSWMQADFHRKIRLLLAYDKLFAISAPVVSPWLPSANKNFVLALVDLFGILNRTNLKLNLADALRIAVGKLQVYGLLEAENLSIFLVPQLRSLFYIAYRQVMKTHGLQHINGPKELLDWYQYEWQARILNTAQSNLER